MSSLSAASPPSSSLYPFTFLGGTAFPGDILISRDGVRVNAPETSTHGGYGVRGNASYSSGVHYWSVVCEQGTSASGVRAGVGPSDEDFNVFVSDRPCFLAAVSPSPSLASGDSVHLELDLDARALRWRWQPASGPPVLGSAPLPPHRLSWSPFVALSRGAAARLLPPPPSAPPLGPESVCSFCGCGISTCDRERTRPSGPSQCSGSGSPAVPGVSDRSFHPAAPSFLAYCRALCGGRPRHLILADGNGRTPLERAAAERGAAPALADVAGEWDVVAINEQTDDEFRYSLTIEHADGEALRGQGRFESQSGFPSLFPTFEGRILDGRVTASLNWGESYLTSFIRFGEMPGSSSLWRGDFWQSLEAMETRQPKAGTVSLTRRPADIPQQVAGEDAIKLLAEKREVIKIILENSGALNDEELKLRMAMWDDL